MQNTLFMYVCIFLSANKVLANKLRYFALQTHSDHSKSLRDTYKIYFKMHGVRANKLLHQIHLPNLVANRRSEHAVCQAVNQPVLRPAESHIHIIQICLCVCVSMCKYIFMHILLIIFLSLLFCAILFQLSSI